MPQKLLASLLLGIATNAFAETHTVQCAGMEFVPDVVDVVPGDVIRWEYISGFPHTATSGSGCAYDGLFHGSVAKFNTTFEWEVPSNVPEVIPYYCIPHCFEGMTGTIYVDISTPCLDITGDDVVDINDLLLVMDAWGQQKSPADVNGDGMVNVTDLLAIVGNWGSCG